MGILQIFVNHLLEPAAKSPGIGGYSEAEGPYQTLRSVSDYRDGRNRDTIR